MPHEKLPEEDLPKKKAKVSDYLKNPNAQKKELIIIALEEGFSRENMIGLQAQVLKLRREFDLFLAKSPKDILRKTGRSIRLVIASDQFCEQAELLSCLKDLKLKKQAEIFPILFLSADPQTLINNYHKIMLAFHETDEYMPLAEFKPAQFYHRIKECLNPDQARRARRYTVKETVELYHFQENQSMPGEIIDLSIYGAKVSAKQNSVFKVRDQVKISIPIARYLGYKFGEFLKLSGRVHRVYLSGTTLAIGFEHVNDKQSLALAHLLSYYVNRDLQKTG